MALRLLMGGRVRFSVAVFLAVCPLTRATPAQQQIRVGTKQVLVPVIVIDKNREHDLLKNPGPLYTAVSPGEQDAITSGLLVHGLAVPDFQLFDDGKQQTVESVTEEQILLWNVRDNRGYHTEYIGPGGGKWSSRHWPRGIIGDAYAPQYYVLAYAPPASPAGSCHQIKVIVKRPNASVRVRPEYCNNPHAASDPLYGTSLGKQMEAFQTLENKNYDSATVNGTSMQYAKRRLAESYTCTGSCSSKLTDIGFSYTVRGETSDVYESTPNSGIYYHVTQTYWANGTPNQLTGNLGLPPTITYNPDGEGRINSVSASSGQNPISSTTYNAAGLPTGINLGSGSGDADLTSGIQIPTG